MGEVGREGEMGGGREERRGGWVGVCVGGGSKQVCM
jgi:hypothetical protein